MLSGPSEQATELLDLTSEALAANLASGVAQLTMTGSDQALSV